MNRAALLLAGLLVFSIPAAGFGAVGVESPRASDPVARLDGTARVLVAGDTVDDGFNSTALDVGATLAGGTDDLRSAYAQRLFEERIRAADSRAARAAVVERTLDALEPRVAALREREREAVAAFAVGDIDERELLIRLAKVHAAATALNERAQRVVDRMQSDGITSEKPYRRALSLERRTESMTGPVRRLAARGLSSADGSPRIYVAASPDGVTLAVVDSRSGGSGPVYVRETVRFDNLDADPSSSFERGVDLYDFMTDRYPWVYANFQSGRIWFPGSVHKSVVTHPQGTITAYVDGSTRGVFREIQVVRVNAMPTREPYNATDEGLTVVVNQTYGGGPAQVRVVDASNGTPVDAGVYVAGERVGTTGGDGTLWTVAPRGQFEVEARLGAHNVTVVGGG